MKNVFPMTVDIRCVIKGCSCCFAITIKNGDTMNKMNLRCNSGWCISHVVQSYVLRVEMLMSLSSLFWFELIFAHVFFFFLQMH